MKLPCWLVLTALAACEFNLQAQTALPTGVPLYGSAAVNSVVPEFDKHNAAITPADYTGQPFSKGFKIQVLHPQEEPYTIQLKGDVAVPVAAGDTAVIRFWARGTNSREGAGPAKMRVNVQKQAPNWDVSASVDILLTREWKEYVVPFAFGQAYPAHGIRADLQFGYTPEEVEIGGIDAIFTAKKSIVDLPHLNVELNPPKPPAKWLEMDYGPFLSATIIVPTLNNITEKGIAVHLGAKEKATTLFDTDLLRVSAGWTDGFLNLTGVAFDGKHGPNPTAAGDPVFMTQTGPGWARAGSFQDPRSFPLGPLPKQWAHYKGLYRSDSHVVFSYIVGTAQVLETAESLTVAVQPVILRTVQIGPSNETLEFIAGDYALKKSPLIPGEVKDETTPTTETVASPTNPLIAIRVNDRTLSFKISSDANQAYTVSLLEGPVGALLKLGENNRVTVQVPSLKSTERVRLAYWKGKENSLPDVLGALEKSPHSVDLETYCKGGPLRWNETITTQGHVGADDGPYVVDELTAPYKNPYHSWLRFAGFDFFSDGRAALCTWSGDVWIVSGVDRDLKNLTWKRYASGLFQALGLKIVNDEVYVLGRDQITRLHDLNHDGEADFYENFNNDIIVSPSFHEFALDLQTDSKGNFYFAKAGAVSPGGRGWQTVTPHNGVVLRVSKDGGKLDVFATGVRAPNGMSVGPHDEITLADNEGTWTPACRINFVHQNDFLGVPDLSHRANVPTDYGNPICWLPHGTVDNSSGGQAWVTSDRWGPFKDQMLPMSYGKSTLFLAMYEQIGDKVQGGVVPFPLQFETGIMRGRFNDVDGQLYLCGLKGWQTTATKEGAFYRVRYTGKRVDMPKALKVRAHTISITSNTELDPGSVGDVNNYALEQWNYKWTKDYGSPEFSVQNPDERGHDLVTVTSAKLLPDKKTIVLEIPDLQPVMQMSISLNLKTADGKPFVHDIYNTITELPAE